MIWKSGLVKMKNKGFTLIELLAVIVILGILLSITTVSVNSLRKKQDEKNLQNVISSILTGAKEYNAKNRIQVGSSVSVSELVSGNYVDFDQNKYPELATSDVIKEQCCEGISDSNCNPLKVKYSITVGEKTYNDCGCEKQEDGAESSEICKE